jgi:hypothetical protein
MRVPVGKPVGHGGRVVLAYGEVTGHCHELKTLTACGLMPAGSDAQLFEEPDGQRYLFVKRAGVLSHEEHDPIAVGPGCYRVTLQREYEPAGTRNVID